MLSIVPGTALAQESVWTDRAPATSPSGRGSHAMAYDGESDRIVLFGGWTGFDSDQLDDTWTYDFNVNAWTNRIPGNGPSPRGAHTMAYDAESDRVILFGGDSLSPETWAYDYNANAWTNMSPIVQPTARYFADMAYDAESDRMVLFGGCAGDQYSACPPLTRGETWSYDFNVNTWTNMNPGPSPSPRHSHRMAYDTESDRIVLFGGGLSTDDLDILGDTWAYHFNANSWTEMSPDVSPRRQITHDMAFDANAGRIILFGDRVSSETWAYDFGSDTWTRTDTGVQPFRRAAPRLAYDTESGRIVFFGGLIGVDIFNLVANDETWSHQLVPSPTPDWVLIAIVIGVVAAAVVAVVAVFLTRRRIRVRKGQSES